MNNDIILKIDKINKFFLMTNNFLISYNEKNLKNLCRNFNIETKNLTANQIIHNLQNLIIPNERKEKRYKQQILKKYENNIHYTNDTDFLTLDVISVEPFCLIEETNHIYQFDPLNLAKYYLKEGNFVNPYNRRPLNQIELRRLDKIIKKFHPGILSLCDEQKRISLLRAQENEHLRVCQFLHRECMQLVSSVLYFVKNNNIPFRKALYRLQRVSLPDYFQHFRQLFLFDYSFACDSISYTINILQEFWNDSTITTTREGCNIVENVISTLTKFMSFVVPMLPILYSSEMNYENEYNNTEYIDITENSETTR